MTMPVDRRDFLRTTGTAVAAGLVLGAGSRTNAKETPAAEHGLRKAVKYTMIGGDAPIVEKFQMLKELGFEGLDMNIPWNHDEVRAAIDKTGVIVHGVVCYKNWNKPFSHPDPAVREEGLQSLLGSIRDAKAYGGSSVLVVPAVVSEEIGYADAYTRSQEVMRKALPLAEELNISLLIENVWNNFLLSPLELARYIDEFESPLVGSYFDVGNVVRYAWPEQWIRILGPRIKKLDIKEYSRELQNSKGPRSGFGVELGDGDCNWPAVMQALHEIGYKGWATAEVRGGDRERLADISARMDRCFASWKAPA